MAVLADHTLQAFRIYRVGPFDVPWFGVFGVFLFFVHTCLVLMWSLERRPHTLDFYIRRAFRIYPLAIVVIVIVCILHLPVNGNAEHPFLYVPITPSTFLANLTLMNNLVHRQTVESVMWSLPIEVQMYLALPMIFVFARKERTIWPFLLLWLLSAVAISVNFGSFGANTISVIPNFLPGVIAYIGFMHRKPRLPGWTFGLLVLLLSTAFELHPSMKSGWCACLLLGLALPFFRQMRRSAITRAAHEIAKHSYSIYLLHIWALALAVYYLRLHSVAAVLAVEFAAVAALAYIGYRFVEEPFIRIGAKIAGRLQVRYTKAPDVPARGLDLT